jgi:hypothetical protein
MQSLTKATTLALLLLGATRIVHADTAIEGGVQGGIVGRISGELDDSTERIEIPHNDRGGLDFDRAHFSQSRESLRGERLYEALDRPDLVERYRERRRARGALLGTGIGLLVAGVLIALPITAVGAIDAKYDNNNGMLVGGGSTLGVTIGAGVALTVAGALFHSQPLSSRKTERLVNRWNHARDNASDEP